MSLPVQRPIRSGLAPIFRSAALLGLLIVFMLAGPVDLQHKCLETKSLRTNSVQLSDEARSNPMSDHLSVQVGNACKLENDAARWVLDSGQGSTHPRFVQKDRYDQGRKDLEVFAMRAKAGLEDEYAFKTLDYTKGPNGEKLHGKDLGDDMFQGYLSDDGTFVKHGRFIKWHDKADNGSGKKLEEKMFFRGSEHGVSLAWYPDQSIKLYAVVQHGKRNGPFVQFHPNGKMAMNGSYKNDRRDGIWETRLEAGHKQAITSYRDGVKNGPETLYRPLVIGALDACQAGPDGSVYVSGDSVSREGSWLNDLKHGVWRYYDYDGSVFSIATYNNGVRIDNAEILAK